MDNVSLVVDPIDYQSKYTNPSRFTKYDLLTEIGASLLSFVIFAVPSLLMVVAMAWTTWRTPIHETLTDVGFMMVPFIKSYYAPDIPVQISFAVFFLWLILTRTTHFFYAIRMLALFSAPMFIYRGLCLGMTVLPDPQGLCIVNSPLLSTFRAQPANIGIPNIIKAYFTLKVHLCGDLIFSGHTLFSLYLLFLVKHLLSVPSKRLPSWCDVLVVWSLISCYLLTIILILGCRFHYSVDILVASFSCLFCTFSMYSLMKWMIRTGKCAWLRFVFYGAYRPRIDENKLFHVAPIEMRKNSYNKKYMIL